MLRSINLWVILLSLLVVAVVIYLFIFGKPITPTKKADSGKADINAKLTQYAEVNIEPDFSSLTDKQREVLKLLIEAGKAADEIFWKQASHVGLDIREKLSKSSDKKDKLYLEYLKINYGPYDRLQGNKPFYDDYEKPLGAGFYPIGMTRDKFQKYLEEHPQERDELTSLYTIVEWDGEGKLRAVPYHVAFAEGTRKMHELLLKAAEITENESLKRYFAARAEDLMKDDFYNSDTLWLKLEGNVIDLVIGPIEVYEDELFNYKAYHEAFVLLKDEAASEKLEIFNKHRNALESRLPVPQDYRKEYKGLSSPLAVAQLVYCGGGSNAGSKTIAFNLPNDERVREETGSKKVLLKNVLDAKFNKILIPIAEKLLAENMMKYLSVDSFSTNVLMHEFSHAFGLNYTVNDETLTVKKALGHNYSHVEECKADIVGLFNQSYFFDKGLIDRDKLKSHYVTFIASIFRSIRFGANEAHGMANLIQFNYMKEFGAIKLNEETDRYEIDFDKLEKGVSELANRVLTIQGDGDSKMAAELIEKYGKFDKDLKRSLESLDDVPVDIVFNYKYDL
jgi:hypothetical protein